MKTVIIGSGNVATHLSLALKKAGQEITQVFSRTLSNANELALKVSCHATNRIEDIITDADIYIFSIKDDALREMAEAVAERLTNSNAVFIHTAGSMQLSIFEGLTPHYAVLYPMQTFSKSKEINFREVPCFVEFSNNYSQKIVLCLAEKITERIQEASSEKRRVMHLAAVFACNFTNHCYRLAEKFIEEQDIDFSLFIPLIQETSRKVTTMSPKKAQTGPMVRNDRNVMGKQLELIKDERTRQIYRLMAESIYEDMNDNINDVR